MGAMEDLAALTGDLAAEARPFGAPASLQVEARDLLPPAAALTPEALAGLDKARAETAAAEEPDVEPVTLDFFGDELPVKVFPLRYKFTWAGERVEAVEVHQLTTAEVARAYRELVGKDGRYDPGAVYSRMMRVKGTGTALPVAVLRQMPGVDGEPIEDCCFGFLPPSFRSSAG